MKKTYLFLALALVCSGASGRDLDQSNRSENAIDVQLLTSDGPVDPDSDAPVKAQAVADSHRPGKAKAGGAKGAVPQVVERGPNHRKWEVTHSVTNAGKVVTVTNRFTELASGLHLQRGGRWVEASDEIELQADGSAAALKGAHAVRFAPNINSAQPIRVGTRDNKVLKSRILGLAYYDFHLQKSVLIADLKDSIGSLVGTNQVVYRDAFNGVKADVRYSNRKGSFEQDVILRERPPLPESFGFNPKTTWLEVWTEFIGAPEPKLDQATRQGWKKSKTDKTLDFGVMKIAEGTAFGIGAAPDRFKEVGVQKHWIHAQGRTFLVEEVSFRSVTQLIRTLPASQQAAIKPAQGVGRISKDRLWPERQFAKVRKAEQMRVAKYEESTPGLVLDYRLVESASALTLQGDNTYWVSDTVDFSSLTIEGGAVVKFSADTSLNVNYPGTITCQTDSYRPAVFTAYDDDSAGEVLPYSTGTPSGTYASTALSLPAYGSVDLHNLHIRYANRGIYGQVANWSVSHSQFTYCNAAIQAESSTFALKNVLMANVGTGIYGSWYHGTIEHLTFDQGYSFDTDWHYDPSYCYGPPTSALTVINSLITSVGQWGTFEPATDHTVFQDRSGVYQTVGGGTHYLATGSTFRNAGTSSISGDLAQALKAKTTYPPIAYTDATISTDSTFGPQAIRDTDTPDLGYHYDTLDYAFGGVTANANLTFTAGTAVGWFRTSSGWYHAGHGIHMGDTKTVTFNGQVDKPNYWVRCNTVQEESTGAWQGGYGPGGITGWANQYLQDVSLSPHIVARFTRCSMIGGEQNHFRDDWGYLTVHASHCEFYGGCVGGYVISCYFTNCFMDRMITGQVEGWPGNEFVMRNCTFRGGTVFFSRTGALPVSVRDCAFDGTAFTTDDQYADDPTYTDYDHNAFVTDEQRTTPTGENDIIVESFDWQTGQFGKYYLPDYSSLINAGSVTSPNAHLYHFTTQVANTKEANSQVDIGYHYVAYGNGGFPDLDKDGVPDYLEDSNGNGVYDSGETDLGNPDTDGDGRSDGQELVDGTNPLNPDDGTPVRLGYWKFESETLAYWRGENSTANEVGSSSGVATDISYVTGHRGQAFHFGGVDSQINFGSAVGNFGASDFAIDFWLQTGSTRQQAVMGKRSVCDAGNFWDIRMGSDGHIGLEMFEVSPGYYYQGISSTRAVNDNVYHRITFVRKDAQLQLYIDGKLDAQTTLAGVVHLQNSTDLIVGRSACTGVDGTYYFTGNLDEIQLIKGAPWWGEAGQRPRDFFNLRGNVSWDGYDLGVDSALAANLKYNDYEDYAPSKNITCRKGSIRMWVKPTWFASGSQSAVGNIISMGSRTDGNGWWALTASTDRTQLKFESGANLTVNTLLTASISTWSANNWYQIVLTYSPSQTVLYINGQVAATGTGMTAFPTPGSQAANGFSIGSDGSGNELAKAEYDELETFNYVLSSTEIGNSYQSLLSRDTDADGLTDFQELQFPNHLYDPRLADTDGNGIADGDEDYDGDKLSNAAEFRIYLSDPLNANTFTTGANDAFYKIMAPSGAGPSPLAEAYLTWIAPSPGAKEIHLTLHTTSTGAYDIYFKADFNTPTRWELRYRGQPGQREYYVPLSPTETSSGFYQAGYAEDSDMKKNAADPDGLPDAYELRITGTGINNADTDADTIRDGLEDNDGDGVTNIDELARGSDPRINSNIEDTTNVDVAFELYTTSW